MSNRHLEVLLIYSMLVVLSVVLILAHRWLWPTPSVPSVWKKYPLYILLNLVFLAAAWLPARWHVLALLLALVGAGANWEISRALCLRRFERVGLPVAAASLILAAEWFALISFWQIWLVALLLVTASSALTGPRDQLGQMVIGLAGGVVYVPLCLASLLWLWHAEDGSFRVVFFYLIIASNDAFAQMSGQLFGRRQLVPRISPGKTMAGAAGGVLCAAVVGAVLSSTVGWSAEFGVWIGTAIGLAGLIGDLVESSWKRALGLKDFSQLLGPHGGVLDRFDALIFAAPIFYLIANI